ncbi:hypothetical protein ACFLXB_00670 [Chloroflexota bacterium]
MWFIHNERGDGRYNWELLERMEKKLAGEHFRTEKEQVHLGRCTYFDVVFAACE